MNMVKLYPPRECGASAAPAAAPQGRSLVVSTVNVPDFFSRVRCYESSRVFNAYEGDRIIGSAACAIRAGVVGGRSVRVGYEFQYFTAPDSRRRGVASSLRRAVESHLIERGVALSYALIMEGNSSIAPRRRRGIPSTPQAPHAVAGGHRREGRSPLPQHQTCDAARPGRRGRFLNRTWGGHDLFEPTSSASLAAQIERTQALDYR